MSECLRGSAGWLSSAARRAQSLTERLDVSFASVPQRAVRDRRRHLNADPRRPARGPHSRAPRRSSTRSRGYSTCSANGKPRKTGGDRAGLRRGQPTPRCLCCDPKKPSSTSPDEQRIPTVGTARRCRRFVSARGARIRRRLRSLWALDRSRATRVQSVDEACILRTAAYRIQGTITGRGTQFCLVGRHRRRSSQSSRGGSSP